jgi:hypothetical protein
MTKLDARQVISRQILDKVLGLATSSLDFLLSQFNKEIDTPIRMAASNPVDAKINFSPSSVESADLAAKVASPVDLLINSFPASTVDFQTGATTGGTFSITFPASTVGRFRRVGFSLNNLGVMVGTFTAESVTEGALANAGTLFPVGNIPVGWIDLVCTNASGQFKTIGSASNVIEHKTSGINRVHRFINQAPIPASSTYTPTNVIRITATGAGIYTPTAGVKRIRVKILGAGGAGGLNSTTGAAGGASSFSDAIGPRSVTCNGGGGGTVAISTRGVRFGGTGGGFVTAGLVSDWEFDHLVKGGDGQNGSPNNTFNAFDGVSGSGGSSFFGGAGRGGTADPLTAALSGGANTGSGGGGLSGNVLSVNSYAGAGGGGAGAYAEFVINQAFIATSYNYSIGAGGVGAAGVGSGGSGVLIIEEEF